MRVTVRAFAGAREALGSGQTSVELDASATIAELFAAIAPDDRAARVLAACSVLVDGVARTDLGSALVDGAAAESTAVDVLPPFAGG